jgi:ubiquinone/menaquinone biosynthesis C-methylase UbiE
MKPAQTKLFYNTMAGAYAEAFIHELDYKPFDRYLLQRFAADNKHRGEMADVGCGPGQTTKYLSDWGVKDITGIDLSDKMIEAAKTRFPGIPFETGNMLSLDKPGNCYGSMLGFYAIAHFKNEQLKQFFEEAYRVIKPGGQLLISFHIGNEVKTVDELLGVKASADFYFNETDTVCGLLSDAGFRLVDIMSRYPYPDKEYPSQRAYIIGEK